MSGPGISTGSKPGLSASFPVVEERSVHLSLPKNVILSQPLAILSTAWKEPL